ncbi:glycosyltransferase family protein, partial [Petrachloros mirabilis]
NIFARGALYEMEDVIRQCDSVEMLAPRPTKFYPYGHRIAGRLSHDSPIAMNPGVEEVRVEGEYDLFFVACEFASDLLHLLALKGWRERCRKCICYIDEVLVLEFMNVRCFAKLISEFDCVFLSCQQGIELVRRVHNGTCLFVPPAVDTLRFCPYPKPSPRSIDVVSLGRRSLVTHKKLIDMAKAKQIFYVYDTSNGTEFRDYEEHRTLIANFLKRAKYFLVNPGKIDMKHATGEEELIANRYFEGAASGCVLIGQIPKNREFSELFSWPDSVIPFAYDSPGIGEVISELERDPERLHRISTSNVVGALRWHDWVYRWESMLKVAGVEPHALLRQRIGALNELSWQIELKTGMGR